VKKKKRRKPSQGRSRERVSRILEAASHEFADHGVEAATMEAIAERAKTSVGSIYQFYPNKLAIYEAIGNKYIEEVRALFAVVVSEEVLNIPWRQIIDATIDSFGELHRTSVTFRAIWSNIVYSRRFLDAGQALNRELADRSEIVFSHLAKKVPPAHRKIMATVSIETISALLLLANDMPRPKGKALLEEAKVMIHRYLEPYLD
jgi:AcrR family transcriptional regulator